MSLMLNYAVYQFECINEKQKAVFIAELALQTANDKLSDIGLEPEDATKDLMDMLNDNLTLWKDELERLDATKLAKN